MFGRRTRKRLGDLEFRDKLTSGTIDRLQKQINQLTCEHLRVTFNDRSSSAVWVGPMGSAYQPYVKECLDCGKIFGYKTKAEWLDAQYKEVPERERRARDIIDPLTGMDERTRQLAEDYVVCLKKNVMNERKARAILARHITKYNGLRASYEDEVPRCVTWHQGWAVVNISGSYTADQLKAIAWWMENKGKK